MHSRICLGAFILGLVGCGVFGSEDTSSPPATGGDPAATADGGLPMGAPPAAVGTPDNNELTNELGVFVTTSGTADGDGTKEHPLASIAAGIERVKNLKLRVYVCAGTYKESLTLVNAVSVIGSLGCDGGVWKTGGARTALEAPTSPAVRAKDIALATRFEGFDVTAPAGTAVSPNSIALIAENATMLTVASAKLTSAKAFDGADGTDATQLTLGATATGHNGLAFDGRELAPNPITGPQQQGGQAAGVGSCVGAAGHDGATGTAGGNGATQVCTAHQDPITHATFYGWDIYSTQNRSNALAASASPGGFGTDGTSATSIGVFSPDGYTAKNGTAGADGAPGQGGKGGDGANTIASCTAAEVGKYVYGASGPGGGAGGCPGLAGTAGTGGGASVAALVFMSAGLTLQATELVAGNGGIGGKGSFGSTPTLGGGAGIANGSGAATAGGAGGRAGFGGNGAGGPSIALAYTGGAPVVAQDTHTTAGAAGAGVAERSRTDSLGNTVTIPASASGPAMPTLKF